MRAISSSGRTDWTIASLMLCTISCHGKACYCRKRIDGWICGARNVLRESIVILCLSMSHCASPLCLLTWGYWETNRSHFLVSVQMSMLCLCVSPSASFSVFQFSLSLFMKLSLLYELPVAVGALLSNWLHRHAVFLSLDQEQLLKERGRKGKPTKTDAVGILSLCCGRIFRRWITRPSCRALAAIVVLLSHSETEI